MIRCNICQKPKSECICKPSNVMDYEIKVVEVEETKTDKLETLSLAQLKDLAKEKGVKGYYKMKRNQLVKVLKQH